MPSELQEQRLGQAEHGVRRVFPKANLGRDLAGKLAFVLTPAWLYLPMARATGELSEYMMRARDRQAGSAHFTEQESRQLRSSDAREWLDGLKVEFPLPELSVVCVLCPLSFVIDAKDCPR